MIDNNIQNELREKYNPDGSDRRKLQMIILDILIEFDCICKKNDIEYWLDSGTLLGAVRHRGFIPWDDDADVCVHIRDYKKMRAVLIRELPSFYKFVDHSVDKRYDKCFPRIIDTRYSLKRCLDVNKGEISGEVWIDIFPMENTHARTVNFVQHTYGRCLRHKWNVVYDSKIKHVLASWLYPLALLGVSLLRIWNSFVHRYKYNYIYCSGFIFIQGKSDIYPVDSLVKFENHYFSAPHNVDGYLKNIYGDYNQIPPEEKRDNHSFFGFVKN